jgi:hypothetical protein
MIGFVSLRMRSPFGPTVKAGSGAAGAETSAPSFVSSVIALLA